MSDSRAMPVRLGGGSAAGSSSQLRAMDLQTRAGAATASGARYGDGGALSARHLLIRRKLMERKRFDSADYAMDKNKRQKEGEADPSPSTAQVGVSAFCAALEDRPAPSPLTMATATTSAPMRMAMGTAQSPSPSPAAARYGRLAGTGAASARSILLQKKLREKKHFDSADYQLAQQQQPPAPQSPLSVGTSGGASPMDVDAGDALMDSPSSARMAAAASAERRLAQMSPSVGRLAGSERSSAPAASGERFFVPADSAAAPAASKYGKLCAAQLLIRRQLRDRKRFDSADYAMERQSGGGGARPAETEIEAEVEAETEAETEVEASPPSISRQVQHIRLSEEARKQPTASG